MHMQKRLVLIKKRTKALILAINDVHFYYMLIGVSNSGQGFCMNSNQWGRAFTAGLGLVLYQRAFVC